MTASQPHPDQLRLETRPRLRPPPLPPPRPAWTPDEPPWVIIPYIYSRGRQMNRQEYEGNFPPEER